LGNPTPELIQFFDPGFQLSDFTVGESGALAYVHEIWYAQEALHLDFCYDNENGILAGIVNWTYPFEDISYYNSQISIELDENNDVYSTILLGQNIYGGELYLISGELDGIVEVINEEIITPKISMQIFPNPFNPETTISFSLTTESTEDTEINIYNIKGQRVKSFSNLQITQPRNHQIVWNGKDMNNKSVSTGLYLFELKAGNIVLRTKKGLLLK